MSETSATPAPIRAELRDEIGTVIVGAGFSGLTMAAELKRCGREDFVILERAREVGGTWRDNSYPGCACDVPSHLYSFSFAPNPDWSSTFSPQPEIQAYIGRVAQREGLLEHVRFGHELESARWDARAQRWLLQTSAGEITTRALVSAAGPLSEPAIPDIPGLRDFAGTIFHSATWDHSHDLRGERIAVIGTGASAIQFVPQIQGRARRLHLFQRTPPWIMPRPDRTLRPIERFVYRHIPGAQRLMRAAIYWGRESYAIPMLHAPLARLIERLARRHLRRQVPDPQLRAKLTPDYAPGCKRILVSNDYLPSLGKENVEVVCDRIAEVRAHCIVTADGVRREVDTIILGTGFHVTDLPVADRILGADGRSLAEHWAGTPSSLRGTAVEGFPNLFFVLGPNTGLGHTSVLVMADAQARYVRRAIEHIDEAGAIEPRPEAQRRWNERVQRRMAGTVWLAGGCESWYIDSNGVNSTIWPDFTFRFRRALRSFDAGEYRRAAPATSEPATPPLPAVAAR